MTDLFGRLMIDIDGFNLTNEDKSILASKHIGGLILFSRNFDSYNQLCNLIKEVRSIKENIICLLYTSPSPRDLSTSRMPSSA